MGGMWSGLVFCAQSKTVMKGINSSQRCARSIVLSMNLPVKMKPGDLVRFAKWGEFDYMKDWSAASKPHVGMIIEYDRLMMTYHILCHDEIHEVRVQLVEKAGKKDLSLIHI